MQLLWLKTELLHPVDKGGKIRTYHMLKELKKTHYIAYMTLDDEAVPDACDRASEYCHDLIRVKHHVRAKYTLGFWLDLAKNCFSHLPYAVAKYQSVPFRNKVREYIAQNAVDVIVCDFLAPSINVPMRIDCPSILFQHNVEAAIWRRHYEVQASSLTRMYFWSQWRKMLRYEKTTCGEYDCTIAVSDEDSKTIICDYNVANVHVVPTGVDIDYFRPSGEIASDPFHVVFTGSMDWLPNDDAIRYFALDILPLIRRILPEFRVTIVGRKPSSYLLELARYDPLFVVTGRVEDVRPYVERASAFILPLRIGSGTRLKVFEAMAMGKPVVSTSIGVEGLPVLHEQDVVIADSAGDFAKAVVRVVTDFHFANKIGLHAANKVRAGFGWDKAAAAFSEICSGVIHRKSE